MGQKISRVDMWAFFSSHLIPYLTPPTFLGIRDKFEANVSELNPGGNWIGSMPLLKSFVSIPIVMPESHSEWMR